MSCFNHIEITRNDNTKCERIVDVCDNVMECIYCLFFLEKHKAVVVDELISELDKIPEEVTTIKVPIFPLPDNKYYYSFNGINTILFNMFKSTKKKHIKNLQNQNAYLKVYYVKNSLFTLPIIQIEIIFLCRLQQKVIDELWKTLKAEVLYFTSAVGEIDVFNIIDYTHLEDLLTIPMIVGHPEFKKEGILQEHRFSSVQIQEMNYLHSFTTKKLEMKSVINNSTIEVFEKQIEAITSENIRKGEDELTNDELIRAIFDDNEEQSINSEFKDYDDDNLPF